MLDSVAATAARQRNVSPTWGRKWSALNSFKGTGKTAIDHSLRGAFLPRHRGRISAPKYTLDCS